MDYHQRKTPQFNPWFGKPYPDPTSTSLWLAQHDVAD